MLYIDPYCGSGYELPADWVLVSHEHGDHNRLDLLIMQEHTRVLRAADLLKDGVYGCVEADGIRVQAVQAYNKNHDRNACVGFVLRLDGVSLYIAGDTSTTEQMSEMASWGLDYALLPMDGKYNMDVEEAMACAKQIAAKHSIPYHMIPGGLFDQRIAESFAVPGRIILKPGEELQL